MKKDIKILAIETSCDETAAAIIGVEKNQPVILSNIVSSQIDLHAKTGGVVPEVASRAHMESIVPVISEALVKAKLAGTQEWTANKTDSEKASGNNLTIEQFNNYAISFLQKEIDFVAVTAGPGLVGSLLVGFNAAKSLAYALDKPIIPVNHIEGHIYSAFAEQGTITKKQDTSNPNKSQNSNSKKELITENWKLRTEIKFPILSLTVSGGHTSLTLMHDHGSYENLGQTLDDAAGEAFDKVAKLLELGYPGGPAVSKLAAQFRDKSKPQASNIKSKATTQLTTINYQLKFPRPILNDGTFNFSFSGLKTAVLQCVLNIKKERDLSIADKEEICAAFEDAVVDVLTTKTMRAVLKYNPKALVLAGGVAANKQLREILTKKVDKYNCQLPTTNDQLDLLIPPLNLCGDNAAMIGLAAYYHIHKNNISSWDKINVDSNLEL